MGSTKQSTGRRVLAAVMIVCSLPLVTGGLVAATTARTLAACAGDVVLNFDSLGVRLLNASGQRSFGPIPLELAPGTYTVTAASTDTHTGGQLTQSQEQWQIVADTGWESPFTSDIPDDEQVTISTFPGLTIAQQVRSIILEHLGAGGVNSVTPLCVGFTQVDIEATPDADDGAADEDDEVDGDAEGGVIAVGDPVSPPDPPTDAGDPDADADDAAAPGAGDQPDPAAGANPDADAEGDEVEVEVQGEVEIVTSLARTGVSHLTNRVLGLALVLIGLGGLVLAWTHRRIFGFD